jgi:hypothetical protein
MRLLPFSLLIPQVASRHATSQRFQIADYVAMTGFILSCVLGEPAVNGRVA